MRKLIIALVLIGVFPAFPSAVVTKKAKTVSTKSKVTKASSEKPSKKKISKSKAAASSKSKSKLRKSRRIAAEPPVGEYEEAIVMPAPALIPRSSRYLREFESGFGMMLLSVPSVSFHAHTRFLSSKKRPIYTGFEMQYSLTPQGYVLLLMGSASYAFIINSLPLAHLSLGVLLGPAFARDIPLIGTETMGFFGEASIVFEIDDLSTIRGQFRPGIVGGRFAFAMSALVGFRFR